MPFPDQVRGGEGDGADVIAVDQRDQDRPEDQFDLERANAVFVQKMRNLNFRLAGHRFPPHFHVYVRRRVASAGKVWHLPRKDNRAGQAAYEDRAARFFMLPYMRRRQRLSTAISLADNPAIASASKSSAIGMRWFTNDWPLGDSLTVTSRLLLAERVRVTRPLRISRVTSRDKVETSMLVRSAKSI